MIRTMTRVKVSTIYKAPLPRLDCGRDTFRNVAIQLLIIEILNVVGLKLLVLKKWSVARITSFENKMN